MAHCVTDAEYRTLPALGEAFPTPTGANPMLTSIAVAHRTAQVIQVR